VDLGEREEICKGFPDLFEPKKKRRKRADRTYYGATKDGGGGKKRDYSILPGYKLGQRRGKLREFGEGYNMMEL